MKNSKATNLWSLNSPKVYSLTKIIFWYEHCQEDTPYWSVGFTVIEKISGDASHGIQHPGWQLKILPWNQVQGMLVNNIQYVNMYIYILLGFFEAPWWEFGNCGMP